MLTALDAELPQRAGETLHGVMQRGIGPRALAEHERDAVCVQASALTQRSREIQAHVVPRAHHSMGVGPQRSASAELLGGVFAEL